MTSKTGFHQCTELPTIAFDGGVYRLGLMVHYNDSPPNDQPHYNIYMSQKGGSSWYYHAYNVNRWIDGDAEMGDKIGLIRFSGYNADVIIDNIE